MEMPGTIGKSVDIRVGPNFDLYPLLDAALPLEKPKLREIDLGLAESVGFGKQKYDTFELSEKEKGVVALVIRQKRRAELQAKQQAELQAKQHLVGLTAAPAAAATGARSNNRRNNSPKKRKRRKKKRLKREKKARKAEKRTEKSETGESKHGRRRWRGKHENRGRRLRWGRKPPPVPPLGRIQRSLRRRAERIIEKHRCGSNTQITYQSLSVFF